MNTPPAAAPEPSTNFFDGYSGPEAEAVQAPTPTDGKNFFDDYSGPEAPAAKTESNFFDGFEAPKKSVWSKIGDFLAESQRIQDLGGNPMGSSVGDPMANKEALVGALNFNPIPESVVKPVTRFIQQNLAAGAAGDENATPETRAAAIEEMKNPSETSAVHGAVEGGVQFARDQATVLNAGLLVALGGVANAAKGGVTAAKVAGTAATTYFTAVMGEGAGAGAAEALNALDDPNATPADKANKVVTFGLAAAFAAMAAKGSYREVTHADLAGKSLIDQFKVFSEKSGKPIEAVKSDVAKEVPKVVEELKKTEDAPATVEGVKPAAETTPVAETGKNFFDGYEGPEGIAAGKDIVTSVGPEKVKQTQGATATDSGAAAESASTALRPLPEGSRVRRLDPNEIGDEVMIPGDPKTGTPRHEGAKDVKPAFQGSIEDARKAGWDVLPEEKVAETKIDADLKDGPDVAKELNYTLRNEIETPAVDTLAPEKPDTPTTETDTHGIANKHIEGIINRTATPGMSAENHVQHGRDLLAAGHDPMEIKLKLDSGKAGTIDDFDLARAHDEALAKRARDNGKKFGYDSPEYEAAHKARQEWHDDVVNKLKSQGSESLRSFQGSVDLDTGDFHSVDQAIRSVTKQAKLSAEQVKKIQEVTDAAAEAKRAADVKIAELVKQLDERPTKIVTRPGIAKYVEKAAADARARLRAKGYQLNAGLDPTMLVDIGIIAAEHVAKGIDAGVALVKEFGDDIKPHLETLLAEAHKQVEKVFETDIQTVLDKRIKRTEARIAELQGKLESGDIAPEKRAAEVNRPATPELEKLLQDKDTLQDNLKNARKQAAKRVKELALERDVSAVGIKDRIKKQWDAGERDVGAIFQKISLDTGLRINEVYDRLTSDKQTKVVADEVLKRMSDARTRNTQVKNFIKAQQTPGWQTFAEWFPVAHFKMATFGHGLVFGVTHAGNLAMNPLAWKYYVPNYFRQQAMLFNRGYHAKMMLGLERDVNYKTAIDYGLDVHTAEYRGDYETNWATKGLEKMGLTGNRGADALKLMRMQAFNAEWNLLPDSMKTEAYGTKLAEQINHATGSATSPIKSKFVRAAAFALKLKTAQWKWAVKDPIVATSVFMKATLAEGYRKAGAEVPWWMEVTETDLRLARREFMQKGATVAGTVGLLAMNQGLLSVFGSDQQVNMTDPTKDDFLHLKAFGQKVSFISPIVAIYKLFANLARVGMGDRKKYEKTSGRYDLGTKYVGQYARGQLSPFFGVVTDSFFQADMFGRPMPWSDDKVPKNIRKQGQGRYTYGEYLATHFTMLPVEEGFREGFKAYSGDDSAAMHWTKIFLHVGMAAVVGAPIRTDDNITRDASSMVERDTPETEAK